MPDTILDKALSKIAGAVAGGDVSSAGTAPPGTTGVETVAPKQSFSDFLINYATQGATSNAQPNYVTPEAQAQQASLASAQAATTAAQQQLASMTGEAPVAAAGAPAAAAAGPPALWKSYGDYWTDKGQWDQAKNYGGYNAAGTDTSKLKWGASGDPYRFTTEYGKYLETLPAGQRATAQAGVGPDWVRSGITNSVYSGGKVIPIEGADYYWQNPTHQAEWTESQKAKTAQTAAAPKAPTRPTGRNVTWQQDQQYWKDLAAYNQGKAAPAAQGKAAPAAAPTYGSAPASAAASGTSAASQARAPLTAPTRPTGNITWQQDQAYWRALDDYNKQNRLGAYR